MSDEKEMEEIHKIIDDMQARLVELFDQFRELRIRLGQKPLNFVPVSASEIASLKKDTSTEKASSDKALSDIETEVIHKSVSSETPNEDISEQDATVDVRVSRLLDPISHELNTGSSPAEVIAEYVQAAKDELIPKEAQNDKVARDMDIVLKFLRARGRRSIRPEERDNILRRIKRWKAHLSK